MTPLLAVLGLAVFVVLAVDVAFTVLDVGQRRAPVTNRVSAWLWQGQRALRARGWLSHRGMETCGIVLMVGVVAAWVAGLWLGWTLLFSSSPQAVVQTSGQPAALWERAYYAGDALFSLSPEGLMVGRPGWRFLSTFAALSGLILVTLAISYFVPVLTAATKRRKCAAYISALGITPQQIVLETWDGFGVEELHGHLTAIMEMLTDLAELHRAYPVLYYVHSADRRTALAPSIATLDEALTLVQFGLQRDGPLPHSIRAARRAIARFSETVQQFPDEQTQIPPVGSLDPLSAEGLPTVEQDKFETDVEQLADHRQVVLAIVEEDGWTWEEAVREASSVRRTDTHLSGR